MKLRKDGVEYIEFQGDPSEPCWLSKEDVEAYAERVAKTYDFEIGTSLVSVVESLEGEIHYLDLDEWESCHESIYVHGEWDFDIILSKYTSPLRNQFTIGHELGHYFLHSNQGETPLIARRDLANTRVEWEANWFSAALLMPAKAFSEYWKKTISIPKIAGRFSVSTKAAKVRVQALNLNG